MTSNTENFQPPLLDENTVERALKLNIIAGVFGIVFWWTISPSIIQLFALRLGAADFHIAVITAIMFLTLPAQILSAYLVEKYRRRKTLWMWSSAIARSMWIPVVLMPVLFAWTSSAFKLWFLIMFFFLYCLIINSSIAPWFSWMTDIVPKEKNGQFWGHRHAYISLVSIIMLPLVGLFLDWRIFSAESYLPFVLLIGFGIVAGLTDTFIHRKIPEPAMIKQTEKPALGKLLIAPLREKPFRRFLVAMLYSSIVMSLYRPFLIIVLKTQFGMSYFQILMLSVAALFSSLLLSRMWGFLVDHFGIKPVLMILFLGLGFLPLVMVLMPAGIDTTLRLVILYTTWFIDCSFAAGTMVINLSFFGTSLPRKNRSMYIAAFYSVIGILVAAAPLVGELFLNFFNSFGPGALGLGLTSYQLLFALGFLLTIPSIYFVRRLDSASINTSNHIIGQIIHGRIMTVSRHLYILNQPANEKRKIKSLDRIEKARNPIALVHLKKHLEDPSEEVREKTRQALETLSIEEETREVLPMVKQIESHGFRKLIKRELKDGDKFVRKNAVERIKRKYQRAV